MNFVGSLILFQVYIDLSLVFFVLLCFIIAHTVLVSVLCFQHSISIVL